MNGQVRALMNATIALTVQTVSSLAIEDVLERKISKLGNTKKDKIVRRAISTVSGFGIAVGAISIIDKFTK